VEDSEGVNESEAKNMITNMITNKSIKKVLIKEHRNCRSVFSKGFGFMLRKPKEYALVFEFSRERSVPLTMFMVFYPLDVLFLDSKKRVVEIKKDLRPFKDYAPKAKAQYVIEFPVGMLGKTKVGDKISF
jgi:uncharacterized protein